MERKNNQNFSDEEEVHTLELSFADIRGQFKIIIAGLFAIVGICGWSAVASTSARVAALEAERISAVMAAEYAVTSKKNEELHVAMHERILIIEKNYIEALIEANSKENLSSNKKETKANDTDTDKERDKRREKIKRICDF